MDFVFWQKKLSVNKLVTMEMTEPNTSAFYDVNQKKYMSTPVFSADEIIREIGELQKPPMLQKRRIQGKDGKDRVRLQQMIAHRATFTPTYIKQRVYRMDQIENRLSPELTKWNRMLYFIIRYYQKDGNISQTQYLRELDGFLENAGAIHATKINESIHYFIRQIPQNDLIQTKYNSDYYVNEATVTEAIKTRKKRRGGGRTQKRRRLFIKI